LTYSDTATHRFCLLYNGQVFNQLALRKELAALGQQFRTTSDTEVVLHCLTRWRSSCLRRLEGQFALAFYDRVEGKLLLARDRIGIKPLYFWHHRRALVFSSQPVAILSHPLFSARLNLHAFSSFLSYRQVLGNETFFEGVLELAPGSTLEFHLGGVAQRRYWSLADAGGPRVGPSELRSRLHAAVAAQLAADVPVGVLLSGGLDSSVLAAEASGLDPSVVAFTAAVPHLDEAGHAARVAAHLDLKHVVVPVGPDDHREHARRLIRQKGAPLGMHNEVETYVVCRAVAQHAKVVLCGEGADELFAGYGRIFRLPFESRLRSRRSEFDLFCSRYTYFPQEEKRALFQPSVWRSLAEDEKSRVALETAFFDQPAASFFERIWWVFVTLHLRGLLSMVDAMAMAAGVEARVPFLDSAVIDAATALPACDKLRWRHRLSPVLAIGLPVSAYSERLDVTKFILRQAYRDVLPNEVLTRRKQAFPVPLAEWYGAGRPLDARSVVLSRRARLLDVMRRPAMEAFVEGALKRADDGAGRQLFQLVNLELFLEEFG
jgi:asparagine synthase (glutamine-hydrolysing)